MKWCILLKNGEWCINMLHSMILKHEDAFFAFDDFHDAVDMLQTLE